MAGYIIVKKKADLVHTYVTCYDNKTNLPELFWSLYLKEKIIIPGLVLFYSNWRQLRASIVYLHFLACPKVWRAVLNWLIGVERVGGPGN